MIASQQPIWLRGFVRKGCLGNAMEMGRTTTIFAVLASMVPVAFLREVDL